jgi:hypothetical protein
MAHPTIDPSDAQECNETTVVTQSNSIPENARLRMVLRRRVFLQRLAADLREASGISLRDLADRMRDYPTLGHTPAYSRLSRMLAGKAEMDDELVGLVIAICARELAEKAKAAVLANAIADSAGLSV